MILSDDELQTVFKAVSLVLANAQLTNEGKKEYGALQKKVLKYFEHINTVE